MKIHNLLLEKSQQQKNMQQIQRLGSNVGLIISSIRTLRFQSDVGFQPKSSKHGPVSH